MRQGLQGCHRRAIASPQGVFRARSSPRVVLAGGWVQRMCKPAAKAAPLTASGDA